MVRMDREIRILTDAAAVANRAAQEFVPSCRAAVREKGGFQRSARRRIDAQSTLQSPGN